MKVRILRLNKSNIKDFSLERNKLLKKTNEGWVLFLDTDETLSSGLKDEIKKLKSNCLENGYYITRENYFLGKFVGRDKIIRLARRGFGGFERAVHELWKVEGRLGRLKNPIIHNTADNVSDMLRKINNYSGLHAVANYKDGKMSNIFKIIFFPLFKFIQSIIKGRGIMLSTLHSFHSFLAWTKQWELTRKTGQAKL